MYYQSPMRLINTVPHSHYVNVLVTATMYIGAVTGCALQLIASSAANTHDLGIIPVLGLG